MARTIQPFSFGTDPGDLDLRPQYAPKDIAAGAAAAPKLAPLPETDAPPPLTALNLGGKKKGPAGKSAT